MKLFSSWNIGTGDVSILHAPCKYIIYIYIYIYVHNILYIIYYIYIYLKLRFSVLIHIWFFFDILQVCYNKIVVIQIKLQKKKHFKLNKLIINCYCYPHIVDNIADNANCYQ